MGEYVRKRPVGCQPRVAARALTIRDIPHLWRGCPNLVTGCGIFVAAGRRQPHHIGHIIAQNLA